MAYREQTGAGGPAVVLDDRDERGCGGGVEHRRHFVADQPAGP